MASSGNFDVAVVGGGIVALATARAMALRGLSVFLSTPELPGTATPLAAGVLGPTIGASPGPGYEFACASRDRYPSFADSIREESGIDIQLDLAGVLRVALTEGEAEELREDISTDARWLLPQEVHDCEPALAPCVGALIHFRDGIVANERLHAALRLFVRRSARIRWTTHVVRELCVGTDISLDLSDESRISAGAVVIAAGAWSPTINGVAMALPVVPLRGQMVVLAGLGLRRAVYGAGGYITPRRDGRILSGSTQELSGFDASTVPEVLDRLESVATSLVPSLTPVVRLDSWAGLRPMSPDGLPIIDQDRRDRRIIYATGHTRNGILMGPLTADVVCDLACDEPPRVDISAFKLARFSANSFT